MSQPLRSLYPEIEPFDSGMLKVSELHTLYYEQSGNPNGKPVVFLHGGPGGGTNPKCRRFFDPAVYRIVLFDQRGCGKSTPHAELTDNTTWHLVNDIERIRTHLGIDRWQVFGGSWGSTLALAYAQTHPDHVTELVLRGIFMLRRWELEWFYQKGCDALYPDAWETYLNAIPEAEHGDLMSAYHRRLISSDAQVRVKAAICGRTRRTSNPAVKTNSRWLSRVSNAITSCMAVSSSMTTSCCVTSHVSARFRR
jgi:proline iminopeptidase